MFIKLKRKSDCESVKSVASAHDFFATSARPQNKCSLAQIIPIKANFIELHALDTCAGK